jgi:alkanesulfonate monooxygenase SsuD/methylene tetrahydromethanopterin reductase-like flavin-dependent oxidoreductase (luciferase family)
VKFSTALFATDRVISPVTAAVAAEARGFSTFYVPEHTHIPVSRDTPHPLTGDVLNDEYRRTLDPWVTLGAIAAATSTTCRMGGLWPESAMDGIWRSWVTSG